MKGIHQHNEEVAKMSKKYENLAAEIVEKVGGTDNVSAVRHC